MTFPAAGMHDGAKVDPGCSLSNSLARRITARVFGLCGGRTAKTVSSILWAKVPSKGGASRFLFSSGVFWFICRNLTTFEG